MRSVGCAAARPRGSGARRPRAGDRRRGAEGCLRRDKGEASDRCPWAASPSSPCLRPNALARLNFAGLSNPAGLPDAPFRSSARAGPERRRADGAIGRHADRPAAFEFRWIIQTQRGGLTCRYGRALGAVRSVGERRARSGEAGRYPRSYGMAAEGGKRLAWMPRARKDSERPATRSLRGPPWSRRCDVIGQRGRI